MPTLFLCPLVFGGFFLGTAARLDPLVDFSLLGFPRSSNFVSWKTPAFNPPVDGIELFPRVVSDFSLIDAIESGIVKIPRVPVSDNNMIGEQPTYRDLWLRIREELPKRGRGTTSLGTEPKLPVALQGALESLYSNYKLYFEKWMANAGAAARGRSMVSV